MPFTFNMLLEEVGIAVSDVRLLRHQTSLPDGRTPMDLLRADRALFDRYHSRQLTAQRAYFAGRYWANFVGLSDGRTLFVGLYTASTPEIVAEEFYDEELRCVIDGGIYDEYKIELQTKLAPYIGRLFVEWGGGASGKRAWKQRADAQNKLVTELQRDASPAPFPGFMKMMTPLSRLSETPPSWAEHLTGARGVYLLSCPQTGENYVGSACGSDGFWGRWMQYAIDGHGGNVALKARERTDYMVSILQVAGSTETSDDILATEDIWKRKLQSRGAGLNRN